MKKLLSLILLLTSIGVISADNSGWKIHPIFDEEVNHVIESPDYVYFTSRNLEENGFTETFFSLFRYDKKGDELMSLSTSNILNGSTVRDVIYNPSKGYLAVLYKDYNIDLIYNNGKVVNIPYYEQSSLSTPKTVNSMSIDPDHDRLFFATDFGYVAINDKKGEIAESRIYGDPLEAFCRVGDTYLAVNENKLIKAQATDPRLSLDQYEYVAEMEEFTTIYPLSQMVFLIAEGNTKNKKIKRGVISGDKIDIENLFEGYVYNIENNSSGVMIATGNMIYQFKPDGSYNLIQRHENYNNSAAGSENMSELWNGLKRKGLSSVKKNGEQWSLTRDWMLPNAPSPYASTSYVNHPNLGLLVLGFGYTPATSQLWSFAPYQLSSYKNNRWNNHSAAYTNPSRIKIMSATSGMALDPENSNYLYISSYHNGIMRLNLSDPSDIIHMSRANDSDAGMEGFFELKPVPVTSSGYSNISAPYFDKQGNLWMNYADWDDTAQPNPHFYCWLAGDRKRATSKEVTIPHAVEFDVDIPISNLAISLPLLKSGNGLIVYANGTYDESLALFDTKGTPVDTSDDLTYPFPYFVDSDGNSVEIRYIKYIWEDPSTGYVWLCHSNGVCYFIPSQIMQGNYQVYRVKVPRNDGTNLADYLLEGVTVNHVATDGEGRKWFSTAGGGIVCTSSDGREIVEEFNTSNSPLPDDVVYSVGYNSGANSLMISTAQGFAEYNLPVSQSSSTKEDIKAYPNPVRPDYSGYVTITDIPTGSFVKIVDSAGNLVKELGIVSGFDILWDLSDSNFNRVKSGVYHIMVSPSDETSSYSTVGKILVIS